MLPLLPLTKGANEARDAIVNDMINGLRAAGKDDMLALGYAFAGLVYETEADKQWLKRRFAVLHDMLEESWSYREMVQKGIDIGVEKGIEKGIEQGEMKALNALRPLFVHYINMHFPELVPLAQQQSDRISKPELLSAVFDKILLAHTPDSVRQILMEIDGDMPS